MSDRFQEWPHLGVGRLCARILYTMYFQGCKVFGKSNIPTKGNYILALNHASIADPPLVWAFFPDPVYFLTKQELHDLPFFGFMCDRVGNIPVRRRAFDLRAIRTSLKYLTHYERNLGIFIEGSRAAGGDLSEAKLGAALLARRTGKPVLPAFIHGSGEILPMGAIVPRFNRNLSLHIGPPLFFEAEERPERQTLEKTTLEIVDAIAELDPARANAAMATGGII